MVTNIQGVLLDGSTGNAVQSAQPLAIGQGETLTINLAVVGVNAQAIDLTGYGVNMRIERADGTQLVDRIGTLVSAPGGTAQVKLLSSETATWAPQIARYIIWITDPSDESSSVILRSDFVVEDNVMAVDGAGSTPGPDMLLIGVPVPGSGDVGKSLQVVSISPLVLGWL